jgi:hypothetical protein
MRAGGARLSRDRVGGSLRRVEGPHLTLQQPRALVPNLAPVLNLPHPVPRHPVEADRWPHDVPRQTLHRRPFSTIIGGYLENITGGRFDHNSHNVARPAWMTTTLWSTSVHELFISHSFGYP